MRKVIFSLGKTEFALGILAILVCLGESGGIYRRFLGENDIGRPATLTVISPKEKANYCRLRYSNFEPEIWQYFLNRPDMKTVCTVITVHFLNSYSNFVKTD